jgi:hypothetical protein
MDSVAIISFRVATVPDCNKNQIAQSDMAAFGTPSSIVGGMVARA